LSSVILLFINIVFPQVQPATISQVADYNDWNWDAVVMQNGLITVATVPVIGARIMQYDLAGHPSIFVNPDEIGNTHAPANNSNWYNYGGYKTWPAPQSRWNWPPPPVLDYGIYESTIVADTQDSVALFVKSPVEKWKAPNLRFERRCTIFKGSTRVRMVQTLINEGTQAKDWSVWDVTQQIVHHPEDEDFDNFWVYFPKNPDSIFGSSGVLNTDHMSAFKGEVAPGVNGVQFSPDNKKIFADSHEGWIAYVDERDGYAYFKVFKLFDGAVYPDDGAHVEVWVQGGPYYEEVEIVSPMIELAGNGGKYTFVEDWFAAKMNGPVLTANAVGAIAKRLTKSDDSFSGTYGIFYSGTARLAFLDNAGTILSQGSSFAVSPVTTFNYSENLIIPSGAVRAELRVYDHLDQYVGAVESVDVTGWTDVSMKPVKVPVGFTLGQNFPNPFNPVTTIEFQIDHGSWIEVNIYDIHGNKVETLISGHMNAGTYQTVWNAAEHATGVYIVRVASGQQMRSTKMVYLK
jgi:hypothetical protein